MLNYSDTVYSASTAGVTNTYTSTTAATSTTASTTKSATASSNKENETENQKEEEEEKDDKESTTNNNDHVSKQDIRIEMNYLGGWAVVSWADRIHGNTVLAHVEYTTSMHRRHCLHNDEPAMMATATATGHVLKPLSIAAQDWSNVIKTPYGDIRTIDTDDVHQQHTLLSSKNRNNVEQWDRIPNTAHLVCRRKLHVANAILSGQVILQHPLAGTIRATWNKPIDPCEVHVVPGMGLVRNQSDAYLIVVIDIPRHLPSDSAVHGRAVWAMHSLWGSEMNDNICMAAIDDADQSKGEQTSFRKEEYLSGTQQCTKWTLDSVVDVQL